MIQTWYSYILSIDMKNPAQLHIRITDGKDDDREYREYWLSRPPGERIAAVEFLREQFYPIRSGEGTPHIVKIISIREAP
jgi:hypothetical protein